MKKVLLLALCLCGSWSVIAEDYAMEHQVTHAAEAEAVVEENKHETCGSQWDESKKQKKQVEDTSGSGKEGNEGAKTHELQQKQQSPKIESPSKSKQIKKKEDKAYILNV